jgi:hypothetical protein
MQPKTLLFLATLLTTALAIPATPPTADDTNIVARDDNNMGIDSGDVSTKATYNWQAKGGCKTDWADRCRTQCLGEAADKSWVCKEIDSDISSSGCLVGWNTCECTCFW